MLSQLVNAAVTSCVSRATDHFAACDVASQCRLMETRYESALAPEGTPAIMHGSYHRFFGDEAVPRTIFYRELLASLPTPPQAHIAQNDFGVVPADGHRIFAVLYHNRLLGSASSEPHPEAFYCPDRGGHCDRFPLSMDVYSVEASAVSPAAGLVLGHGVAAGAALGVFSLWLYWLLDGSWIENGGGDATSLLAAAAGGGAGAAVSRRFADPLAGILGAAAVNAAIQAILHVIG